MENKHNVAILDKVAVRYGQRPSALLNITDPMVALDFDLTIASLGARIESGKPTTVKELIQNRNAGLKALTAMQSRVQSSYQK